MRRTRALAIALATIGAAITTASASGRSTATPTLVGTVGPGFTISLKEGNKVVKTLKAGKYTFLIHDKASIHAFSLDGPRGFAKDFTTVPFVGTKFVTVTLAAGKYKYFCPPHEAEMFGHFTVT
ncbi:MAG TPA: plastocyanin/azurin family copper-binding protein [Gaiellaceae bacterium]